MSPKQGTMLVVDDDVLNRTLLVTSLEEAGYTVEMAEDGLQALERLHARYFDVAHGGTLFLDESGHAERPAANTLRENQKISAEVIPTMGATFRGGLHLKCQIANIRNFAIFST